MAPNLGATPALALKAGNDSDQAQLLSRHLLRIEYPRYFPSVPLNLYLEQPVQHPNVHPDTGFVCLWQGHQVANTIEHAIHKCAAILGWRLLNLAPEHVMQPGVLRLATQKQRLQTLLFAAPLLGVNRPEDAMASGEPIRTRRRRLS